MREVIISKSFENSNCLHFIRNEHNQYQRLCDAYMKSVPLLAVFGRAWYNRNLVGWVIEYRKNRLWKGT